MTDNTNSKAQSSTTLEIIDLDHVQTTNGLSNKYEESSGEDDDQIRVEDNRFITKFYLLRSKVFVMFRKSSTFLKRLYCALALCLYLGYFSYAMFLHHGERKVTGLIIITCIIFLVLFTRGISRFDPKVKLNVLLSKHPAVVKYSQVIVYLACIVITCSTLVTEVILVRPENLISVTGVVAILFIFFVTSIHPHRISWHPVFLGLFLQYVFALAILRLPGIRETFIWCGDVIEILLKFPNAGGKFLFGSLYLNNGFAFNLIPLAAFIIAIISILEHLGVLHALLRILGRFWAFCTGASPSESLNASANIFMGPIDSLMVIRPYLNHVTPSELHCLMANAMSTVNGSIIGLYVSFGILVDHLLAASVMLAPAALAVAKLAVPERSRKTDAIKKIEEMIPTKTKK